MKNNIGKEIARAFLDAAALSEPVGAADMDIVKKALSGTSLPPDLRPGHSTINQTRANGARHGNATLHEPPTEEFDQT